MPINQTNKRLFALALLLFLLAINATLLLDSTKDSKLDISPTVIGTNTDE